MTDIDLLRHGSEHREPCPEDCPNCEWVTFINPRSGPYQLPRCEDALSPLGENDLYPGPDCPFLGACEGGACAVDLRPIHEIAAALGDSLPEAEREKLPADLARNLDHYLYGDEKE